MNVNKIFIYPTDTIYGIGCNAEVKELVGKVREIKGRDSNPFSVIAPSKEWILENFKVDQELIDKYLPGPYTLILEKKDSGFLNWVSDKNTLGVRIPDHPFTSELQKSGKPIITTSVNFSGKPFAKEISEVPEEILKEVDSVFDIGRLSGNPSTLVIDGKEIPRN